MLETDNQRSTRTWEHWVEPDTVRVDGQEIACRTKGSGPTVLFLHGAGLTRMWLPFCEELSSETRVIAPEHPGFGDSPRSEALTSIEDYALFYDAFLRQLPEGPVHLVGHSLGGWIAATLLSFYPERFESATLLNPAGLPGEPGTGLDSFRAGPEEAQEALFNGRVDRYASLGEQEGFPDDAVQAYEEDTTLALLTWHPRYDLNLQRRLHRVRVPVQIIGSEQDRLLPFGSAEKYAELIPDARFETFVGDGDLSPSGHLPHIEEPSRLAEMVLDFVRANTNISAEKILERN